MVTEDLEATEQHPFEYAKQASFRAGLRFYVERLAFTRRGNFAFIVGMLYSIYDMVSRAVTVGTPVTEVPMYAGQANTILQEVAHLATGGMTILIGVLAGILVLVLMDAYESEYGLSIEPDH